VKPTYVNEIESSTKESNNEAPDDHATSNSTFEFSPVADSVALAQACRAPRSGKKSPIPVLRYDIGEGDDGSVQQHEAESAQDHDEQTQQEFAPVDTDGASPDEPALGEAPIHEDESVTKEASSEDSQMDVSDAGDAGSIPQIEPIQIEDFGFSDGTGAEAALDGTSVRDKLQSCADALKLRPDQNMIVAGRRAESLAEIARFVKSAIGSKGRKGYRDAPAFLHVCGAPGSGKTMGVKRCCDKAVEQAKRESEKWEKNPAVKFMNASPLLNRSKESALQKTLEEIELHSWQRLKISNSDEDSNNAAMILVLDEFDLLVADSGSNSGTEEYLRTLIRWASDQTMRFVLIGISNTVGDNKKGHRLKNLGMVRFLEYPLGEK
jgi:hypothetical protein